MLIRINKLFIFICVFILTNVSQVSHAQYLTGPVASGMGGAGLAGAEDAEQFLMNPATVVHSSKAASGLIYIDGYSARREHDRIMGITLSDNESDLLFSGAYGFFDRRRTYENLPGIEEQYHQFTLANWIYKHISLGVSLTYTKSEMDKGSKANAFFALFPEYDSSGDYTQIDGSLGLHYNPNPNFGLGFVAWNLASADERIPFMIRNLNKIGIGTHFIVKEYFRFRMDIVQQTELNPDDELQLKMGFETKLSTFWLVRGGYESDGLLDRDYYTLGLGFGGPRLKVDYFYRKNPDYSDGAMHGVDMRLPFW